MGQVSSTAGPTKRNKLIVIGINIFSKVSNLAGCVTDAKRMKQMYTTLLAYSDEDIELITDEQATAAYICEQIRKAVADYEGVTVYWASHGAPNARAVHAHDTIVPYQRIFNLLRSAKRKCLLVDACFTGFPTTLGSGQAEPLPSNLLLDDKHLQAVSITDLDIRTAPLFPNQSRSALWNRKVQPVAADVLEELRVSVQTHGCIVLTASRSHQASVEVIFNNEVRGAFTVFLLEAFKAGEKLREAYWRITCLSKQHLDGTGDMQLPVMHSEDAEESLF